MVSILDTVKIVCLRFCKGCSIKQAALSSHKFIKGLMVAEPSFEKQNKNRHLVTRLNCQCKFLPQMILLASHQKNGLLNIISNGGRLSNVEQRKHLRLYYQLSLEGVFTLTKHNNE